MTFENNKQKLYWLIDLYLEKKIDGWLFCTEYHNLYNIGMDLDTLTPHERKIFCKLSKTAGRFSDIEEDLKNYPGTYVTKAELLQELLLAKKSLSNS